MQGNMKFIFFLIVQTPPAAHRENCDHLVLFLYTPHSGSCLQGLILQRIATPVF